jgi:hypothetical protein
MATKSEDRRRRQWERRQAKAFERDYGPVELATRDVWKFPELGGSRVEPTGSKSKLKLWVAPTVVVMVAALIILKGSA